MISCGNTPTNWCRRTSGEITLAWVDGLGRLTVWSYPWLRGLLKHGEPSEQTAKLAEEIREMIREGCPEALEL